MENSPGRVGDVTLGTWDDRQRDRLGDTQAIGIDERETTAIDGLFQCGDQATAVLVATDIGQPLPAWLADFFLVNRGQS